jgi:hypothetical protein
MPKKKDDERALTTGSENLPAFLQDAGTGRGQEKIEANDLQMPRIKLLQPLSPEAEDGDNQAGDMLNSLTHENYGKELTFIPIVHFKSRIYWKPREEGGGILCSSMDAQRPNKTEYAKSCGECDKKNWDNETKTAPECVIYYNFIVIPEGTNVPVALSMEKTKLKAAKKLISLAKYAGGNLDMFAKKYKITTKKEKNDRGSWFTYVVDPVGYVTEAEYKGAEAAYESLKGIAIPIDQENI